MLTERDEQLIKEARRMGWEEIDEDAAESVEGRQILHDIAVTKYHREEFSAGML